MSSTTFDASHHPRGDHGRFASARGRAAIINAVPAVRYHTGPSLGAPRLAERSPGPGIERRSLTRGEAWQRIGNKINALPVHYTGEKTMERPVGTYLHLTLDSQIPKTMSVQDHQARVKRFIQLAKDKRKEIMDGAEKARVGKKHVYLKASEPASGGVDRWRMKPDKYPEGTSKATLHRAYNHAALLAMHDRGLADYDFKMDDALKDELKPTEPFIRYARQRLNNEADIAMQGERRPYVQAFGKPFADLRTDKTTGEVRRRLRPNQQLIKAAPRLKAAGLMLMHGPSDSPKILLLKRASGGDHQGEWCFPGGKIEPGETPRQAAIRETREEIGPVAHGRPQMWARRIAGGVDFTTFAARVPTAYEPVLNDEHSDWKWASPDDLPSPMHPGCAVAIDKLAHRSKGMVLGKASPFGGFRQAVRNGMARAATSLDSAFAPEAASRSVFERVNGLSEKVRQFTGSKAPHTTGFSAYTAGRWTASNARALFRQPVQTGKKFVRHSAQIGAGFGHGISDEFGGSPRTRRVAGRIGAAVGAIKLPVVAGAIAAKPISMAYHEFGGGADNQPKNQSAKLAKSFDETKHRRSHTGEFIAGAAAVAGTGGAIAAAPVVDRHVKALGRKRYRRDVKALKAAGGQVMYRGAPAPDPKPIQAKSSQYLLK